MNSKFSAFNFQCDTPEDVQDWVTAIEKLRDSKTVRYMLKDLSLMKVSEICPLICGILITVFVKKKDALFGDLLKTGHRS